MATTFTGGDLKAVANDVVQNISETLLPMQAFALNVDTTGLYKGDKTQVFVPGTAPAALAYNSVTNNYMTDNGGEHSWKPLHLDQHVKISFTAEAGIYERLGPRGLASLYKTSAVKVADKITKDVYAAIAATAAFQSYAMVPEINFDKSEAGKIETELAKLVGTGEERNLILNFGYFDYLRDSLSGIYANPTNNEVLRTGEIPGVCGFSKVLRTTALNPSSLVGIATNKTGIAISIAAVKQVSSFRGDVEIATEEFTGIPLTFSTDYIDTTRTYIATVEAIYGIGVMSEKGVLKLTYTGGV